MFEFAWPWLLLLAPLPWLLRILLPPADSGEAALNVSFLDELEGLAGRRARANLPAWRQQAPFAALWLLLLLAAARARGLETVDGLEMLIGQAALAFELFFGAEPPRDRDDELRDLLLA